ncbi:MAG: DegV family protein [Clostridia bacterium]|nr:DegV family protein [Clostridia bacterium]
MNNNYVLFLDSDCDITPEFAKKYGCELIIMPYKIGEKEIFPYVDFEEYDYHTYFDQLRHGVMPTTNALSPADYVKAFEPTFKAGKDILYVHFSSAMSGTFNAMRLAYESLKEKYPERQLYTIDTKGITLCAYGIVCEVAEMYKQGASAEELLKWAETEVDKFATYFFVTDLSFFRRSGRVKALAAIMGNIIGIKPIINMDGNGVITPHCKVMGTQKVMAKLLEYVDTLQDHLKDHKVIITHSDALPLAEQFEQKLKEKFGADLKTEINVINPTIGAHCGPDGIGVCFHAIHR